MTNQPCGSVTLVCACSRMYSITWTCPQTTHTDLVNHEFQCTIYHYASYICNQLRDRDGVQMQCDADEAGLDGYPAAHNFTNAHYNRHHSKSYIHCYLGCGCMKTAAQSFEPAMTTTAPSWTSWDGSPRDLYFNRTGLPTDVVGGGTMKHVVTIEARGACQACVDAGKFPPEQLSPAAALTQADYDQRANDTWSFQDSLPNRDQLQPCGHWTNLDDCLEINLRRWEDHVWDEYAEKVAQNERKLKELLDIPLGLGLEPEEVFTPQFMDRIRAAPPRPDLPPVWVPTNPRRLGLDRNGGEDLGGMDEVLAAAFSDADVDTPGMRQPRRAGGPPRVWVI